MDVYFISGLATDSSIFRNISLPHPYRIVHLEWVEPRRGESLRHYTERLAVYIDTSIPFALVGLSFGGMVALEMSKFLSPACVILISSVRSHLQVPVSYRLAGFLHLEKLLPDVRYIIPNPVLDFILGIKRTSQERKVIKALSEKISMKLLRWSIGQATRWRCVTQPPNIYHIHGIDDRVFPVSKINPDIILQGGHVIVVSHAKEISLLIAQRLKQCN